MQAPPQQIQRAMLSQDTETRWFNHVVISAPRMYRRVAFTLALLFLCSAAFAANKCPLSEDQAAQITARGRLLAEYDEAAWHATDALLATSPDKQSAPLYVAKKTSAGWTVAFGRFNDTRNKFLIVYEATQEANPQEFSIKRLEPPQEDSGFFLFAARAISTALKDFHGENRPYNTMVLPLPAGEMYVYVVPAQTVSNVYPLGGDSRYLVSADGDSIVEARRLHKAIIERSSSPTPPLHQVAGGYHTHVLSDVPEDTDVFFVLSEHPSLPEYIGTKKQIYVVGPDGSIACAK